MQANPSGMCVNCIRSQVDITSGIPKAQSVQCCRGCERYLQPPRTWIACAWESRELLTVCIKRLKGLNKVKLVDAAFVWTEPHSKRIKTKLTVQKEVSGRSRFGCARSQLLYAAQLCASRRSSLGPFCSKRLWWSMSLRIIRAKIVTGWRQKILGKLLFSCVKR